MDGNNQVDSSNVELLSKKSWLSYVIPLAVIAIITSIMYSTSSLFGVLGIVSAVLVILHLRSYELYVNDEGVWVFSGIFPWNKGVRGVKWRDLDEAVYFTGFVSWALKSHTLKISHRYTQGNEIYLKHMASGVTTVSRINQLHQSLITHDAVR